MFVAVKLVIKFLQGYEKYVVKLKTLFWHSCVYIPQWLSVVLNRNCGWICMYVYVCVCVCMYVCMFTSSSRMDTLICTKLGMLVP
jgi:hypothetical protein